MAWKKRTRVAVIAAILVVVLGVVFAYFRFASQEILVESASRMEDVYTQVNSAFRSTISKNWRLLKSWQSYISQTAAERPEELQAFFQMEQEDWHYSEFYFLAEDGSYITSQGGSGRLELGEKLDQLMAGENLVTDGKLAGEEHIAFFAIPMEPGLYQGFVHGQGAAHRRLFREKRVLCDRFHRTCYLFLPGGGDAASKPAGGPARLWQLLRQ